MFNTLMSSRDVMMKRNTQPDQNNPRSKIKYISRDSFQLPLFRHINDQQTKSDTMYTANGMRVKGKVEQSTEYSKSNKNPDAMDDEFDDNLDNIFDKVMSSEIEQIHYRNDMKGEKGKAKEREREECRPGKSKYIEQHRTPIGTYSKGGFGKDLDHFAELKGGINKKHSSIADKEMDRFHFTYTKFQDAHWGSFPQPISTRTANKKVIN